MIAALLGHNPRQSTRVNALLSCLMALVQVLFFVCQRKSKYLPADLEPSNCHPEPIGHAAPPAQGKPLRESSYIQVNQKDRGTVPIVGMYVCTMYIMYVCTYKPTNTGSL